MNEIVASIRVLHIVGGFLAFVGAPAAMATAKGGPGHRRWGRLYFYRKRPTIAISRRAARAVPA